MNKALKIGLWAAGIGLLFYIGKKSKEVYDLTKGVTFRLVDFGIPSIKNFVLSLPLKLQITNPTAGSLTLDNVTIAVSAMLGTQYQPIGGSSIDKVTITPGVSTKDIVAKMDLKALKNISLDTIISTLATRALGVKADVLITTNGVTLPTQVLTKTINV